MPGARRKTEPLLYPPLSAELKARMRKAGHADMVLLLDEVSLETIKGLMRASQSGPMFKPGLAAKYTMFWVEP